MILKPLPSLSPTSSSLLCGGVSTLLSFTFPLFPVVGMVLALFSTVPLFGNALRWGRHAGFLGCLVAGFLHFWVMPFFAFAIYFVLTLLPTVGTIFLLFQKDPLHKKYYSLGTILSYLIWGSILCVALLSYSFQEEILAPLLWLQKWVTLPKDIDPYVLQQALQLWPALLWVVRLGFVFLNLFIAYRFLLGLGLPLQRHLAQKQGSPVPPYWDIVLISCILLFFSGQELAIFIAKNTAFLACVPLFVLGSFILYRWLHHHTNGSLWFVGFVTLSVLFVWPCFLLIGLGVLEPPLQLQKRLGTYPSPESK